MSASSKAVCEVMNRRIDQLERRCDQLERCSGALPPEKRIANLWEERGSIIQELLQHPAFIGSFEWWYEFKYLNCVFRITRYGCVRFESNVVLNPAELAAIANAAARMAELDEKKDKSNEELDSHK